MSTAAATAYNAPTSTTKTTTSIYELFLDIPHPLASVNCPPPTLIGPPPNSDDSIAKELGDERSVANIKCFAFPEADDRHGATAAQPTPPSPSSSSSFAQLNKYDVYIQNFGWSQHVFSLQLACGTRVHGHVYKYLPLHVDAKSRGDVGRRGVRAMVILTRISGGIKFFLAVLKTLESLSMILPPLNTPTITHTLHTLHASQYTLPPLEIPSPLYSYSPLHIAPPSPHAPILPLLRTIGPTHTLRILSAILSERRIIFSSKSPTILSACLHSLMAILKVGLLEFPHVFIPILPPRMIGHLMAPMPYVIGVLEGCLGNDLNELGEVVIMDLEKKSMDAVGFGRQSVGSSVPDLLRGNITMDHNTSISNAEILHQDLIEILSTDRKLSSPDSLSSQISATAKKTNAYVRKAISRMRSRATDDPPPPEPDDNDAIPLKPDEYSPNESGEDECRMAFAAFWLALYGDWGWYLSADPAGVPYYDKQKFIHCQKQHGNYEGTAMYPLVGFFSQSAIFEGYCNARIGEIKVKAMGDTAFHRYMTHHRKEKIQFNMMNARRVVRMVNRDKSALDRRNKIRALTMMITSNQRYEGNAMQVMETITEQCREVNVNLSEVMDVIWFRIRDSTGGQWRHGLQALYLLRNLLINGPITVVAEANNNIGKIFQLKSYNAGRFGNGDQVRALAREVYMLIVDKRMLFTRRRYGAEVRRVKRVPSKRKRVKNGNLKLKLGFRAIHQMVKPNVTMQMTDLLNVNESTSWTATSSQKPTPAAAPSSSYADDLLGFDFAQPPTPAPTPTTTIEATSDRADSVAGSTTSSQGLQSDSHSGGRPFDFAKPPAAATASASSLPAPSVIPQDNKTAYDPFSSASSLPPALPSATITPPAVSSHPPPAPTQQQQQPPVNPFSSPPHPVHNPFSSHQPPPSMSTPLSSAPTPQSLPYGKPPPLQMNPSHPPPYDPFASIPTPASKPPMIAENPFDMTHLYNAAPPTISLPSQPMMSARRNSSEPASRAPAPTPVGQGYTHHNSRSHSTGALSPNPPSYAGSQQAPQGYNTGRQQQPPAYAASGTNYAMPNQQQQPQPGHYRPSNNNNPPTNNHQTQQHATPYSQSPYPSQQQPYQQRPPPPSGTYKQQQPPPGTYPQQQQQQQRPPSQTPSYQPYSYPTGSAPYQQQQQPYNAQQHMYNNRQQHAPSQGSFQPYHGQQQQQQQYYQPAPQQTNQTRSYSAFDPMARK